MSGRCTDEGLASVGVGWGAEQVYAGCCLDKSDLDAVCGCGVSEYDVSLGERQRPRVKEQQALICHVLHVLLHIGDLEGDVIHAFSAIGNESGYRAFVVIGSDQAYGGISEVESGTLEAGVDVVFRAEHGGGYTQDVGIRDNSMIQVSYGYTDVDEALYHAAGAPFLGRTVPPVVKSG